MPVVHYKNRQWFELQHKVCFQETNLVGNVYYSNHLAWQGRCREMFLRECCPQVLELLPDKLVMVTLKVVCEYYHELFAFDQVVLRMHVAWQRQNRMSLAFDYLRISDSDEQLIAQGEQQVACLARRSERIEACPFPAAMIRAIEQQQLMARPPLEFSA